MTLTGTDAGTEAPTPESYDMPLISPQLPRRAPQLVAVMAVGTGVLCWLLLGGVVLGVVVGWLIYTIGLPAWSLGIEGSRKATDRLVTALMWSTFAVALIPLVSLLRELVVRGHGVIRPEFFTSSMRGVLGEGGGIYHALMGTLIITALAALISVPVGVMAAIYLIEYGDNNRTSRIITFLVDVMVGIPSIVAGLFAYALFSLIFGPGVRLGIGGAVALAVLMVPIVVRATEEMLKLVPDELREASYALGVPKWRTIVKVVLPTALAGIITGVTLAIARVAGETAPLLIIVGLTPSLNLNPFEGRMATLPVFIYNSVLRNRPEDEARAWGAALVLVIIVMVLNLIARLIGKAFAPKTGR